MQQIYITRFCLYFFQTKNTVYIKSHASKFTKFTTNSPESKPKRRLLNKAHLYEHQPHRNNNNIIISGVQKIPSEDVLRRCIALYIGFISQKCHKVSIKKQFTILSSHLLRILVQTVARPPYFAVNKGDDSELDNLLLCT